MPDGTRVRVQSAGQRAPHLLAPLARPGWAKAGYLALAATLGICSGAQAAGRWISHPLAVSPAGKPAPISLQFRREFTLKSRPRHAYARVSADNRYVLFVNGERVSAGPSRGDLAHWRYRRLDLAPHLRKGVNVLAAEVWNDADVAPAPQLSARTGFWLSAEDEALAGLSTGAGWQVRVDRSRAVSSGMLQIHASLGGEDNYYVAGAPETFTGADRAWDWKDQNTAAKDWVSAVDAVGPDEVSPWALVQDRLPEMRFERGEGGRVVRAEGAEASGFPNRAVSIPANTRAVLLLDSGRMQAAYPQLTISGGRGAKVTLTYAEALYGPNKKRLTNRAQVEGGQALGLSDTIRPDGGVRRAYQPNWWRAWRFVEIQVQTGAEPLTLEGFERFSTGYPFEVRGRFVSSDPQLNAIWRIGWDTVRLDAHETYMDTAYWEQLQYIGDTRLQAIITYMVAGDPRLPTQALDAFDHSRTDGITRSAWPNRIVQFIPPFSLLWVGMLHDSWRLQPDLDPLRRSLPGVRSVLEWYSHYVDEKGLLRHAPGWRFIDWRPGLSEQPQPSERPKPDSCIVTMMYLGALRQAAELEMAVGEPARAKSDLDRAEHLAAAVRTHCWVAERGLFADTPEKLTFSQQGNALAVLYDVAPKPEQVAILDRITVRGGGLTPPAGVTGVTYYFAFYLARALDHAGLGDRYLELMLTWRGLLKQNFTTWPEKEDPSRTDSHAWTAHPTADLLSIVAGVQPASPGFRTVRIAPHLGELTSLDAATAHPRGVIETRYRRQGDELHAVIKLPHSVSGEFEWKGRSRALREGTNNIHVTAGSRPEPASAAVIGEGDHDARKQ